jgi:hypothetical protein
MITIFQSQVKQVCRQAMRAMSMNMERAQTAGTIVGRNLTIKVTTQLVLLRSR